MQPRKIHLSPLASTSSTAQHSLSLERGRGVTGECTGEPGDTPMEHKIPIAGKNKYLFYLKSFLTMSPSTRCWWAWGHRHVSLSVALDGIATSRFAKYQQYFSEFNQFLKYCCNFARSYVWRDGRTIIGHASQRIGTAIYVPYIHHMENALLPCPKNAGSA